MKISALALQTARGATTTDGATRRSDNASAIAATDPTAVGPVACEDASELDASPPVAAVSDIDTEGLDGTTMLDRSRSAMTGAASSVKVGLVY